MIPYNYRHDRLSALAALTVFRKPQHLGRYLRFQPSNLEAVHTADFLRPLLRHLRGHVIVLWDQG